MTFISHCLILSWVNTKTGQIFHVSYERLFTAQHTTTINPVTASFFYVLTSIQCGFCSYTSVMVTVPSIHYVNCESWGSHSTVDKHLVLWDVSLCCRVSGSWNVDGSFDHLCGQSVQDRLITLQHGDSPLQCQEPITQWHSIDPRRLKSSVQQFLHACCTILNLPTWKWTTEKV